MQDLEAKCTAKMDDVGRKIEKMVERILQERMKEMNTKCDGLEEKIMENMIGRIFQSLFQKKIFKIRMSTKNQYSNLPSMFIFVPFLEKANVSFSHFLILRITSRGGQ